MVSEKTGSTSGDFTAFTFKCYLCCTNSIQHLVIPASSFLHWLSDDLTCIISLHNEPMNSAYLHTCRWEEGAFQNDASVLKLSPPDRDPTSATFLTEAFNSS